MAARIFYYNEVLSRSTTTTTDYSQFKASVTFTPTSGKTYAIFWNGLIDANITYERAKARLRNTTTSATYGENLFAAHGSGSPPTDRLSVGGVALYTAPSATAQTFRIEYGSYLATTTTGISETCIMVIELIDGVDIWGSNTAVLEVTSATYATRLALSWTPGTAGDYLVFSTAETSRGNDQQKVLLNINNGALLCSEEAPPVSGGGGTVDWFPHVAMARLTNVSAAQTAWIQHASMAGGTNSIRNAYAVALRMNQFDGYFWDEDRVANNTSTTSFTASQASIVGTPLALQHLIMACGTVTTVTGSNGSQTIHKITIAGSDMGTILAANNGWSPDKWIWFQMRKITPAAVSQTWQTMYSRSFGGDVCVSDEQVLVLMQLEASPGTGQPASKRLGGVPYMARNIRVW